MDNPVLLVTRVDGARDAIIDVGGRPGCAAVGIRTFGSGQADFIAIAGDAVAAEHVVGDTVVDTVVDTQRFRFALTFTFTLAFAFSFAFSFALALALAFAFAFAFAFALAFAFAFAQAAGAGRRTDESQRTVGVVGALACAARALKEGDECREHNAHTNFLLHVLLPVFACTG